MHPSDRIPPHRTLRLYEWLLLLALMGLLGGVRAESVYKCSDGQGAIAYQSQPCPAHEDSAVVALDPAPAYAPSPHYAVSHESESPNAQHRATKTEQPRDRGFECRASNGVVFYRLGGCPRSIAATDGGSAHRRGRNNGNSVSVSARPISRAQACAEMRRPGAIGRNGHEFDDKVSTYDRNLGKDPCK